MRFSTQIKPISYVKAHAAELLDRITEEREPIIITQNGEARAVLVDVRSYDESQETMAMWQILAIGKKQIEAGQTYPLAEVIAKIRSRGASMQETSPGVENNNKESDEMNRNLRGQHPGQDVEES
jgi:prevent-host-death family protein